MLEEKVFEKYESIYNNIFSLFYPALESNGFTERNLTVNFSKAYEQTYCNDRIFSWFELPLLGNKNNEHFDCIIVNVDRKEVFFVEAKRYPSVKSKKESSKGDIIRIEDYIKKYFYKDPRFENYSDYKLYGLILADVWQENTSKVKLYNSFVNEEFFDDVDELNNKKPQYKTIRFNYIDALGNRNKPLLGSEQEYDLLVFWWEI